jgi:hypothetical protein
MPLFVNQIDPMNNGAKRLTTARTRGAPVRLPGNSCGWAGLLIANEC